MALLSEPFEPLRKESYDIELHRLSTADEGEVRDVVDLMTAETGETLPYLAIDGGASLNDLLCQLQADIARLLIKRSEQVEITGLGAAFLAGLGVGFWADTKEISHLARISGEFSPKIDREDLHVKWRDAIARSLKWAD